MFPLNPIVTTKNINVFSVRNCEKITSKKLIKWKACYLKTVPELVACTLTSSELSSNLDEHTLTHEPIA